MSKEKIKKENKNKKLVLLDAHAILHRAYHALPDFATSSGVPTGALYGLVSMVLKIISDLRPDYIVACYDLPKPTYRHEVYENYKSGRAKTDDSLVSQLEQSKDLCRALNIPIYSKEGFEADDMLGTIVEILKDIEINIIIASGDMDTLQLVKDDKVQVYTLKKGINDTILYNEKLVNERFGFGPALLPDYKGLRGDPSDNIIGIEGIGEKTATELIKNFGAIENIYKKLKKDEKKFLEIVRPRIVELLKNGEEEAFFSKALATIRRDAPIDFELPAKVWSQGINIKEVKEKLMSLEFRSLVSRFENVLLQNIDGAEVKKQPKKIEEKIQPDILDETALALWVVDSNITDPKVEDILNFGKTDSFEVARQKIITELKNREVDYIYEEIEKPLIPILKKMQKNGILVDRKKMSDLNKTYSLELKKIESQIWQLAGVEFNVASPKQLGEILFEKLNLVIKNHKKTGSGAKSTRESELEKMKDLHPIIPLVLEYREISKLISTYIDPIPKLLDENNRLHARFVQSGTTTGRMSSENPNLQNIPVSSQRGLEIRKAFITSDNFVFGAFDYSQIELRIAAILSQDEVLMKIFREGLDVHTSVAAQVFGVEHEKVTKDMRRQAKIINFGILYGMGVNALRENLGTDRQTAQEFLTAYFEKFKGLAQYLDSTKERAHQVGYTRTIFGRRRYFEGIKSKLPFIRAAAERMAINAPIQGTQADIIKMAMKRIDDWIKKEKFEEDIKLCLQIHDELVYEISELVLPVARTKIVDIMQNILNQDLSLGVPIIANCNIGKNWGELK